MGAFRWRWALSHACLLMLAVAVPAAAAPVPPSGGPYEVYLVSRVGPSLAPFTLTVRSGSYDADGSWWMVGLARRGRSWANPEAIASGDGGGSPSVFGPVESPPLPCPSPPGCRYPVELTESFGMPLTPEPTSRYYVVSTHLTTNVQVSSKSWRVQRVAYPGVRRLTSENTDAMGVKPGYVEGVERFRSASAPGGRYGSAVLATVPCDLAGVGSAKLSGRGAQFHFSSRATCPLERPSASWYQTAETVYPTTWRLEGDVTGVARYQTRMFVFDYPRP